MHDFFKASILDVIFVRFQPQPAWRVNGAHTYILDVERASALLELEEHDMGSDGNLRHRLARQCNIAREPIHRCRCCLEAEQKVDWYQHEEQEEHEASH